MNTVGRNDKCPCGSGKKYKKCCADPSIMNKLNNVDNKNYKKAIDELNTLYTDCLGKDPEEEKIRNMPTDDLVYYYAIRLTFWYENDPFKQEHMSLNKYDEVSLCKISYCEYNFNVICKTLKNVLDKKLAERIMIFYHMMIQEPIKEVYKKYNVTRWQQVRKMNMANKLYGLACKEAYEETQIIEKSKTESKSVSVSVSVSIT